MKALSLDQPYAILMALGLKEYETRSWITKYRGQIAIHATARKQAQYNAVFQDDPFLSVLTRAGFRTYSDLPFGAVVAVAELVAIYCANELAEKLETMGRENELEFGNFAPGRYAWRFANVKKITPIPAKGKQGLWEWDREI